MSRKTAPIVLATILLLAVGTTAADELIHFTNGTSMPILNHRFEGEMIHVRLTGNSEMAFPASVVDKIEQAGANVYLNPAFHPTNQAVPGERGTRARGSASYEGVSGRALVPARYRGGRSSQRRQSYMTPEQQMAIANGQVSDELYKGPNAPKRSPLGTKFRPPVADGATPPGVIPVGGRYSIPKEKRLIGRTSLQPRADRARDQGSSGAASGSEGANAPATETAPAPDPPSEE